MKIFKIFSPSTWLSATRQPFTSNNARFNFFTRRGINQSAPLIARSPKTAATILTSQVVPTDRRVVQPDRMRIGLLNWLLPEHGPFFQIHDLSRTFECIAAEGEFDHIAQSLSTFDGEGFTVSAILNLEDYSKNTELYFMLKQAMAYLKQIAAYERRLDAINQGFTQAKHALLNIPDSELQQRLSSSIDDHTTDENEHGTRWIKFEGSTIDVDYFKKDLAQDFGNKSPHEIKLAFLQQLELEQARFNSGIQSLKEAASRASQAIREINKPVSAKEKEIADANIKKTAEKLKAPLPYATGLFVFVDDPTSYVTNDSLLIEQKVEEDSLDIKIKVLTLGNITQEIGSAYDHGNPFTTAIEIARSYANKGAQQRVGIVIGSNIYLEGQDEENLIEDNDFICWEDDLHWNLWRLELAAEEIKNRHPQTDIVFILAPKPHQTNLSDYFITYGANSSTESPGILTIEGKGTKSPDWVKFATKNRLGTAATELYTAYPWDILSRQHVETMLRDCETRGMINSDSTKTDKVSALIQLANDKTSSVYTI